MVVNLLVFVLPLASIWVLRLYESELVRRTEAELIGQGALIKEAYVQAVRRTLANRAPPTDDGDHAATLAQPPAFGLAVDSRFWRPSDDEAPISPRPTQLDRSATNVLPDTPAAKRHHVRPDPIASAAGARVDPMLRRATRTTLSGMRVVGPRGVVVATSRSGLHGFVGGWEEVRRGLRGEPTSFLRARPAHRRHPSIRSVSRATPVRVFVGYPVVVSGRVWGVIVLSRTPLDVAKALYLNRRDLTFAALVLLSVVGLVAFLTSRFLARPLAELRQQAARVASGERGAVARIEHAGTQEVAELSDAIARMAEALQGRATYLEAFSRNVSHAFKTPLTTIRGTIELLQDHLDEMSPEQRARFLGNLDAEASRLDRLVRRLMVLARADVLAPDAGEEAPLTPTLADIKQRYRDRCEVVLEGDAECSLPIAAETLDTMIDNLVDNSARHGARHVAVTVSDAPAQGTVNPQRVQIDIRDDGPGIDPDIADELFEPFVTTAGAQGGTGLGLAIVRALARAHGGDLQVMPSTTGAHFRLTLRAT